MAPDRPGGGEHGPRQRVNLASLSERLGNLKERWRAAAPVAEGTERPPPAPQTRAKEKDGVRERNPPHETKKPLTANTKKILAASAAAFFMNLTSSAGALFPIIQNKVGFLEVTTFPKDSLLDIMNLEGYTAIRRRSLPQMAPETFNEMFILRLADSVFDNRWKLAPLVCYGCPMALVLLGPAFGKDCALTRSRTWSGSGVGTPRP